MTSGLTTRETLEVLSQDVSELAGRAAVDGSRAVQDRIDDYGQARNSILGAVMMFVSLNSRRVPDQEPPHGWAEAWQDLLKRMPPVTEALKAVQVTMRDELAEL
jgi:hypothetical protein